MNERRAEQRFMCSHLVTVELENQAQTVVAYFGGYLALGGVSGDGTGGARGREDGPRLLGSPVSRRSQYCVFNQTGYQVGMQLTECKWSKENYEPEHLLDTPLVDLAPLMKDDAKSRRLLADLMAPPRTCCGEVTCPRADISRLMEPDSPLPDRVRVVARAVAWTCEEMSRSH